MSETTKGIYYQNNYNAQADILKDMKLMAESIDEVIGASVYDDTKIKQDILNTQEEQTEQNTEIETLKAECKRLKEENTDLKNSLPIGKDSGEDLTLEDSANMTFKKLQISGNTWQETREGKNLTNYKNWIKINTYGNLNITKDTLIYDVVSNAYGVNDIERTLKANTAYTAFCEHTFTGTFGTQYGIRAKIGETWTTLSNSNILNFTTDNTGKVKLAFYIDSPYAGENATLTIKNIRLYEGTYTANDIPDYEQYGAMPSMEIPSKIRNCGDNINLFDGELELGTLNNSNGNTNADKNALRSKNFTEVKSNTEYTISNDKSYAQYIYEYDENKTFIKFTVNQLSPFVFTTSNTTKYIKFRTVASLVQNDITTKFKIEKGTIETPYSKFGQGNISFKITNGLESTDTNYKEQNYAFPLTEGQRLYKNSYLADDEIHHVRASILLNGTETWVYDDEYKYFRCPTYNFNGKIPLKGSTNKQLSNVSEVTENWNIFRESIDKNGLFTVLDENYKICIRNLNCKNTNEFKEYLSSSPIVIEYDLLSEEIETYTEEQKAIYDKIMQTVRSYKGTTRIFSTDEISPTFDLEYVKDLGILLSKTEVTQ